jgi:hypothetical protein
MECPSRVIERQDSIHPLVYGCAQDKKKSLLRDQYDPILVSICIYFYCLSLLMIFLLILCFFILFCQFYDNEVDDRLF